MIVVAFVFGVLIGILGVFRFVKSRTPVLAIYSDVHGAELVAEDPSNIKPEDREAIVAILETIIQWYRK